ncbi:hypothetical protein OKA06_18890 [Novosphingobium sp. MW5]|nr:hypothetical protein [Novosphingobium sp. MW5]
MTQDITVINDPATIFTRTDADPALVEGMTAAIFDHLDQLIQVHGIARRINNTDASERADPDAPGRGCLFRRPVNGTE